MLQGRAIYEIIEDIGDKEVAVLTDLDPKGRELYSRLKNILSRRGVKINNRLRELLFRTKLRHIEGLATYLKNS